MPRNTRPDMRRKILKDIIKSCAPVAAGFVLAALACFVITLCGCKSQKEVQVERVEVPVPIVQEHTIESVKIDHVRDTLVQRDSVFHFVKGDTVLIERWHYYTNNNNAIRIDTLIKVDSVQVPVVTERVVTKVQEIEKPLKWWQRALMMLGDVMLIVTGLTLAHWLGKRHKNI